MRAVGAREREGERERERARERGQGAPQGATCQSIRKRGKERGRRGDLLGNDTRKRVAQKSGERRCATIVSRSTCAAHCVTGCTARPWHLES